VHSIVNITIFSKLLLTTPISHILKPFLILVVGGDIVFKFGREVDSGKS